MITFMPAAVCMTLASFLQQSAWLNAPVVSDACAVYRVRPLKLVRKGIASEADSDLTKSNLNDAAEYIYIYI